jgi:acyl-CoA synthetase (AMP-forming)/AMP-acid ligase II
MSFQVLCGDADVRIVHPETRAPLADGTVGEVWASGASVCDAGYWGLPDESAEAFGARLVAPSDGGGSFLRTGDLGFVADGHLFIAGRLKDVLIIRGRNLHSHDIEASVGVLPALRPVT